MNERELFRVRTALIQWYLRDKGHKGVLLSRPDNFAMATGGKRNYIYQFTDAGACSLLVPATGAPAFVGDNIEETREMDEEVGPLGCESMSFPWFHGSPDQRVKNEFGEDGYVSDDGSLGPNVDPDLAYLRSLLTETELDKYRGLGRLAAEAMTATLETIERGMTEADIAARLAYEAQKRRCLLPVSLVAADDRIAKYRHPLPTKGPLLGVGGLTERRVEGYVMVVGCFHREGLIASMTRFKKVGELPEGVADAYQRICAVDALLQEATGPGSTLGDVFKTCQEAYADLGFAPTEWHHHHQGGATGYAGRTCKATPGEAFPILEGGWSERVKDLCGLDVSFGQAFAWNPSAPGVKSEDTFILAPDGGKEIVTATPDLPTADLQQALGRPTEVVKSAMA
jgi:antitoxin VapB